MARIKRIPISMRLRSLGAKCKTWGLLKDAIAFDAGECFIFLSLAC